LFIGLDLIQKHMTIVILLIKDVLCRESAILKTAFGFHLWRLTRTSSSGSSVKAPNVKGFVPRPRGGTSVPDPRVARPLFQIPGNICFWSCNVRLHECLSRNYTSEILPRTRICRLPLQCPADPRKWPVEYLFSAHSHLNKMIMKHWVILAPSAWQRAALMRRSTSLSMHSHWRHERCWTVYTELWTHGDSAQVKSDVDYQWKFQWGS
jgi:hypothetical protein